MIQLQERMKKAKADDGFTLIELLLVIIILGVLSAVVIFSVQGLTDRGEEASCKTDRRILRTAEEAYYAKEDKREYTDEQGLVDADLLEDKSSLHDIAVAGDKKSYTIAEESDNPECAIGATTTTTP